MLAAQPSPCAFAAGLKGLVLRTDLLMTAITWNIQEWVFSGATSPGPGAGFESLERNSPTLCAIIARD